MTEDNVNRGYIKLYRSVFDNEWLMTDSVALHIWIVFLLKAKRDPLIINTDGTEEVFPPGSFMFGMRKFAAEYKIDKDMLARRIKLMKERDMIATEARQKGSVVSITNWDTYQGSEILEATTSRQERTQTRINKKKEEYKSSLRGGASGRIEPELFESPDEDDLALAEHRAKTKFQYPAPFESAWALHPKGNKADAYRSFSKALRDYPAESVEKAIKNYVAECNTNKTEPKFRKDLSTFLNKDRFIEYIERQPIQLTGKVYQLSGGRA